MKKISIQTAILPQDMNMEEEAKSRKGPDQTILVWEFSPRNAVAPVLTISAYFHDFPDQAQPTKYQ
ncbi:MAG: hypothetical protein ACYDBT_14610 [Desulfobulbaceae bacterium]